MSAQDLGDLTITAHRLDVNELPLRQTIDEQSPHPALDVLAAIVNAYGIDPCWLLYGAYNCASHRRALEEGATRENLFGIATTPSLPPDIQLST